MKNETKEQQILETESKVQGLKDGFLPRAQSPVYDAIPILVSEERKREYEMCVQSVPITDNELTTTDVEDYFQRLNLTEELDAITAMTREIELYFNFVGIEHIVRDHAKALATKIYNGELKTIGVRK